MKQNNISIIIMLTIAILLTNCNKDEQFVKEKAPVESEISLKINEIFSNSNTYPDWLEIYNPGNEDIDITGFEIYDKIDAKYTWPSGTIIHAKEHLVLVCDKDSATANAVNYANFKLSSGGESVTLLDKNGNLIDEIDFPALESETTYARVPDGTDNWSVANPTRGTANSNENNAPLIVADTILYVHDNARFTYNIVVTDPSGVLEVKLFYKTSTETNYISMAPLDNGEYTYTFPLFTAGEVVEYYIEATDVTYLKSYFSGTSPDDNLNFTVADGMPIFKEVSYTPELPVGGDSVLFNVEVYDNSGINEVKVYYMINDTTTDNKEKITLSTTNGINFSGYIPAQNTNDIVRYYLRVKDINGNKTYYPAEEIEGSFNHDNGSTWPSYTYKDYDTIVNIIETYTGVGPLTKLTFASNPTPALEIINLELDTTGYGEVIEARVYFDVRETPAYVKANKVKGENDPSFTQTGVNIDLTNVDAEDENGDFSGNTSIAGTTVTFYIRIATANAEYYYGHDGVMYIDETPGGGTIDESDDFKADPTLWSSYLVQ